MEIGKPEREIIIEPLEDPVPRREPEREPAPALPVPSREPVPA